MKHLQGIFMSGYVKIRITGEAPETFIQLCIQDKIVFWDVKCIQQHQYDVTMKLRDVAKLRNIKRGKPYKITFVKRYGFPFLITRLLKRKEFVIAISLSLILVLFLSNILWKISITGVSQEMEQKIQNQLSTYGITEGSLLFSVDSSGVIQQSLTDDIPELLWIGVKKKGTTFEIEGIEKTIITRDEVDGPRDLVATKKGIIKKMYVSKGLPKVKVNDYVDPGKILVSGNIKDKPNEDEKSDEDSPEEELVAAEAEITAHTWYETKVKIPLQENHELLTGKQKKKHHLKIGSLKIPIWGFGTPKFSDTHKDIEYQSMYLLNWKLPFSIGRETISEKKYEQVERTVDEAIEKGIEQAKHDLKLQLGMDTKIISEKVLHQSTHNGKVNINLHIVVEEDIVKEVPIN